MNLWNYSVEKFLKRKTNRETLFNIYSQNLSDCGLSKEIRLNIPEDIEKRIINKIYQEKLIDNNNMKMLFLINCNIKNILEIFKKNEFLIIFKVNNNIYFYFDRYFILNEIIEEVDDKSIKISKLNKKKYNKNIIEYFEIENDSEVCFCYSLIG